MAAARREESLIDPPRTARLTRRRVRCWPKLPVHRSAAVRPLSEANPAFDVQVDEIIDKARGGPRLPRALQSWSMLRAGGLVHCQLHRRRVAPPPRGCVKAISFCHCYSLRVVVSLDTPNKEPIPPTILLRMAKTKGVLNPNINGTRTVIQSSTGGIGCVSKNAS